MAEDVFTPDEADPFTPDAAPQAQPRGTAFRVQQGLGHGLRQLPWDVAGSLKWLGTPFKPGAEPSLAGKALALPEAGLQKLANAGLIHQRGEMNEYDKQATEGSSTAFKVGQYAPVAAQVAWLGLAGVGEALENPTVAEAATQVLTKGAGRGLGAVLGGGHGLGGIGGYGLGEAAEPIIGKVASKGIQGLAAVGKVASKTLPPLENIASASAVKLPGKAARVGPAALEAAKSVALKVAKPGKKTEPLLASKGESGE